MNAAKKENMNLNKQSVTHRKHGVRLMGRGGIFRVAFAFIVRNYSVVLGAACDEMSKGPGDNEKTNLILLLETSGKQVMSHKNTLLIKMWLKSRHKDFSLDA